MSRPPERCGVRRRLRRGAYLLPSAFTIGNILLGFYAIVLRLRGDFEKAALLVLGGRRCSTPSTAGIARMTGTESDFGREYDSLADVFTFGAAPALLAYLWGLEEFGDAGWLVPLFFLVCTATRLARFNVQTQVHRQPLLRRPAHRPPPPAASSRSSSSPPTATGAPGSPRSAGRAAGARRLLMVSTFRYRSFKKLDLRKSWSYRALLLIAAVLITVAYHPPAFFLAVAQRVRAIGAARLDRRSPESPQRQPSRRGARCLTTLAVVHPTTLLGKELREALEKSPELWDELRLLSTDATEVGTLTESRGSRHVRRPGRRGRPRGGGGGLLLRRHRGETARCWRSFRTRPPRWC